MGMYYIKKCLCCGNKETFVFHEANTNPGLTRKDFLKHKIRAIETYEDGLSIEGCEICEMDTKQETVAWYEE